MALGSLVKKGIEAPLSWGKGRQLSEYRRLAERAEAIDFSALSVSDLKAKAEELRHSPLAEVKTEALALASESAFRALQQRPYRSQLIGAQALQDGNLAEMPTGEGKTLTAVLASYLSVIDGCTVHIATVNDYLAQRDCQWMAPLYELLGLSADFILSEDQPDQRARKYQSDVLYAPSRQLGFDYLRDNLAKDCRQQVQGRRAFVIIDEADSVLIDEARSPLIISAPIDEVAVHYQQFAALAADLEGREVTEKIRSAGDQIATDQADYDYQFDPKRGHVAPTERGLARAEQILGSPDLYSNPILVNYFIQALKAEALYKLDRDYAIVDGQVKIVDPLTGRISEGRRWADGLHQAVEAKEGLETGAEQLVVATITVQNYFLLYPRRSGMSGTAQTESREFSEIYGMEVVVIPPHRPSDRLDDNDQVYRSKKEKWAAVYQEVKNAQESGRPILIGTTSVQDSEHLSDLLGEIPHRVLNARPEQAAQEAEIISAAGQVGAVTVATNMAGRGVDIRLGPGVAELGGLLVIGTEHHEARRIDNQLRGRAGRQGDPGESRFIVSAEDDLLRLFAGQRFNRMFSHLDPGQALRSRLVTQAIANAQEKVELDHYAARKKLFEFDSVLNEQRQVIYSLRQMILSGDSLSERFERERQALISRLEAQYLPEDLAGLAAAVEPLWPEANQLEIKDGTDLRGALAAAYQQRRQQFGEHAMAQVERQILLLLIDFHWREHLYDMDYLRRGIGLRGIAGIKPLTAYQNEGYQDFEEMLNIIWERMVQTLMHASLKRVSATQATIHLAPETL